ncbi:MAG: hypothetical protein WC752_01780 [Patescibacteria group bacterium]|jgi:hypothetical protein
MKSLKIIALLSLLVLTGASCFNANDSDSGVIMNEMDYFNTYVEELNLADAKLETLHSNYEDSVPLEVKAEDEITFDTANKTEATTQLEAMKTILLGTSMKISATEKQNTIEGLLQDYIAKYEAYVTKYDEVGQYYANQTYKTDAAKAVEFETQIQEAYSSFQTAEDAIFTQLETYQSTSVDKASLSSEDPLERLNATIDYLTTDSENLYNAYMDDWDVVSEPATVRENYQTLLDHKEQTFSSLEEMDFSEANTQSVKQYFDENYKIALENFVTDFNTLLTDYDAGKVTSETIADYDSSIQTDYESIIDSHNEVITLTNEAVLNE